MSDLLYADDFVLCGESEEDLRAMVGSFVEVCRRKGLKVNAGNSKVILLGEEEGLECEVCVDGIRLEHVSQFNQRPNSTGNPPPTRNLPNTPCLICY